MKITESYVSYGQGGTVYVRYGFKMLFKKEKKTNKQRSN